MCDLFATVPDKLLGVRGLATRADFQQPVQRVAALTRQTVRNALILTFSNLHPPILPVPSAVIN
jgi:hypothetical protein